MRSYVLRFIGLCLLPLVLSACSSTGDKPVINFIGIGTGSLVTNVNTIKFANTFKRTDTKLVAVVSFAHVAQGTKVQATWFSPDDRLPPLGRTTITTESGAKIARFSFASKKEWKAAPYELRIDATNGKGSGAKSDSGTLAFFIGMTKTQIKDYEKSYAAYKKQVAKQNAKITAQQQKESKLAQQAARFMDTRRAFIVFRKDLTQSGKTDYLIQGSDTTKEDATPPPGGATPGVLYAAKLKQFAVLSGSGNILLAVQKKPNGLHVLRTGSGVLYGRIPGSADLQLAVLPSDAMSLSWTNASKKTCSLMVTLDSAHQYQAGKAECQ